MNYIGLKFFTKNSNVLRIKKEYKLKNRYDKEIRK